MRERGNNREGGIGRERENENNREEGIAKRVYSTPQWVGGSKHRSSAHLLPGSLPAWSAQSPLVTATLPS